MNPGGHPVPLCPGSPLDTGHDGRDGPSRTLYRTQNCPAERPRRPCRPVLSHLAGGPGTPLRRRRRRVFGCFPHHGVPKQNGRRSPCSSRRRRSRQAAGAARGRCWGMRDAQRAFAGEGEGGSPWAGVPGQGLPKIRPSTSSREKPRSGWVHRRCRTRRGGRTGRCECHRRNRRNPRCGAVALACRARERPRPVGIHVAQGDGSAVSQLSHRDEPDAVEGVCPAETATVPATVGPVAVRTLTDKEP